MVIPIGETHRSDIATDTSALLVGSPTLNNNLLPTVADSLTYIKGLKPKNVIGAAFGSYGWSGEAVKQINEILESIKITVLSEGVKAKYVPTEQDLKRCFELGELTAHHLHKICQE